MATHTLSDIEEKTLALALANAIGFWPDPVTDHSLPFDQRRELAEALPIARGLYERMLPTRFAGPLMNYLRGASSMDQEEEDQERTTNGNGDGAG